MKRIILTSICMFSLANAMDSDRLEKGKELIEFLIAAKTRTIHESPEMVEKWLDFKARELRAGIREAVKMKIQIQDPEVKAAWRDLIRTKIKLLIQLEALPVPAEGFRKSLRHKARWIKLEAEKMALIAEELRSIADQTGIKSAAILAEIKDKKAEFLMHIYRAVMAGKIMGAAKVVRGVRALAERLAQGMSEEDFMDGEETEEMESTTDTESMQLE